MSIDHAEHRHQLSGQAAPRPAQRWLLWPILAILAFYLLTQHREHVLGALPYLIFLACPLMHFFHKGAHGGHAGHGAAPNPREEGNR